MAPFLSHLVIGERVWLALDGAWPASEGYGTFLFGCLAPDVDKFCAGLEQATTHFLPKDPDRTWVQRRTQHFLEQPGRFLRAAFPTLEAMEQALVLGYLCHVATDEMTGRLAGEIYQQAVSLGVTMPSADAMLTAVDPRLWSMALDPEAIVEALEQARIPGKTLPFAPPECLRALHSVVLPQVREGGGLEPYLGTVRRHWRLMHHNTIDRGPADGARDAELEARLAALQQELEADLPLAEQLVDELDLHAFMRNAVDHSCQRIQGLLAEENRQ
ncbi:MAG: zinc dependent phospholipase C family protein [Anaerolineae bacterium]|nr:zinc dependent phospholipase C family protein [Anaerolineae bacterium]